MVEDHSGQAVYNPVNGEWFVVFEGTEDPSVEGPDIFGQRIASDGTMIGPHIPLVIKNGFQREPNVACDPVSHRYLVTWFHNTDAISRRIYSRLFDSAGSPLTGEVKLSEVDDREKFDPTVVFNPVYNEYLAAWSDYRAWPGDGQDNQYKDIWGQRVDTGGLKLGANIPIHVPADPVTDPNGQDSLNGLACNTQDGNYAIGFTKLPVGGGDYKTYAMVFDRTASWSSGQIPMSAPDWGAAIMPAYNPITNTYFFAYGTTGCMGREVSPAGVPLGTAETLHPGGVRFPALAVRPSDGRFLLAKAGDFDFDGDGDQTDFGRLQVCFTAAGALVGAECGDVDLDHDLDVDQADLGLFQTCAGGAGATPGC